MTTITNQTLTLTITSGSVDTVIRKDNCRIDVFGDYVRITDFNLDRYEFLYTEVDSPASGSADELAEALQEFLNTAGGGGGGGVASVTGDIVDNTDPANPIVFIPQGDYVPVVTLEDNAVVATPVIARYTDYGDTVDVRLRVEYEADASAGSMSFLVSTPVGSAATTAIATFNGSNGGDVNFIVARGQGANILIEITIIPDSTGDFDCVINYKKA
jgi:hypothetical protein